MKKLTLPQMEALYEAAVRAQHPVADAAEPLNLALEKLKVGIHYEKIARRAKKEKRNASAST